MPHVSFKKPKSESLCTAERIKFKLSQLRRQTIKEIKSVCFWRDCGVEVLATFMLLTVQVTVVLAWDDSAPPSMYGTTLVHQGLVMGFIVCSTSWAFGDFGGCIMNPAVTIGMVACQKISLLRGGVYIVAQCIGAVAGSGFIAVLTPSHRRGNLSATNISPELDVWQGVLVEMWLTFMLICVVHGATNHEKKGKIYMPTIIIGFFVAVAVMTGSAQTGASMNPARSFGPAVIMNKWQNHWIYWVGPICGALLGTGVFYLVNSVKEKNHAIMTHRLSIVPEIHQNVMRRNSIKPQLKISADLMRRLSTIGPIPDDDDEDGESSCEEFPAITVTGNHTLKPASILTKICEEEDEEEGEEEEEGSSTEKNDGKSECSVVEAEKHVVKSNPSSDDSDTDKIKQGNPEIENVNQSQDLMNPHVSKTNEKDQNIKTPIKITASENLSAVDGSIADDENSDTEHEIHINMPNSDEIIIGNESSLSPVACGKKTSGGDIQHESVTCDMGLVDNAENKATCADSEDVDDRRSITSAEVTSTIL